MKKQFAFGILVSLIAYTSCTKDKTDEPTPQAVDCETISTDFTNDIAPIFAANCATAGCHNAVNAQSGIVLETYAQIMSETEKPRLIASIEHTGNSRMPSGRAKLSDDLIQKIKCWKEKGYPQ